MPEAGHGVCRACIHVPRSPGGGDLWRARKPELRQGVLWGLVSYSAASTPPAQLHPGRMASFQGPRLAMVFAVPDFSSRSRRGGPICGTCFTGALWWRVWLASSPPVRATAIPALAFHSLMQMHFLYSGVSTQFHGSSYGGAAELRGDVVAWLACLFPSIRAHRMGLVEVVPAPAMPWPRQAQYCTIGSSSAVCGGYAVPAGPRYGSHPPHCGSPHQCMATSQCPIECNSPKLKDVTWDCSRCGIAYDLYDHLCALCGSPHR